MQATRHYDRYRRREPALAGTTRRILSSQFPADAARSATPRDSAKSTSGCGKYGTSTVTSMSPRSLSSFNDEAGRRTIRCMVQVDCVGDDRRGSVGHSGGAGEHGHAVGNAEAETPAAPAAGRDAANGLAVSSVKLASSGCLSSARRWPVYCARSANTPNAVLLAFRQIKRNVAAVVDVRALDAFTIEGRDQFIGDTAGNRGHRRDKARTMRMTGGPHAACDRASQRRFHVLPAAATTSTRRPAQATRRQNAPSTRRMRPARRQARRPR